MSRESTPPTPPTTPTKGGVITNMRRRVKGARRRMHVLFRDHGSPGRHRKTKAQHSMTQQASSLLNDMAASKSAELRAQILNYQRKPQAEKLPGIEALLEPHTIQLMDTTSSGSGEATIPITHQIRPAEVPLYDEPLTPASDGTTHNPDVLDAGLMVAPWDDFALFNLLARYSNSHTIAAKEVDIIEKKSAALLIAIFDYRNTTGDETLAHIQALLARDLVTKFSHQINPADIYIESDRYPALARLLPADHPEAVNLLDAALLWEDSRLFEVLRQSTSPNQVIQSFTNCFNYNPGRGSIKLPHPITPNEVAPSVQAFIAEHLLQPHSTTPDEGAKATEESTPSSVNLFQIATNLMGTPLPPESLHQIVDILIEHMAAHYVANYLHSTSPSNLALVRAICQPISIAATSTPLQINPANIRVAHYPTLASLLPPDLPQHFDLLNAALLCGDLLLFDVLCQCTRHVSPDGAWPTTAVTIRDIAQSTVRWFQYCWSHSDEGAPLLLAAPNYAMLRSDHSTATTADSDEDEAEVEEKASDDEDSAPPAAVPATPGVSPLLHVYGYLYDEATRTAFLQLITATVVKHSPLIPATELLHDLYRMQMRLYDNVCQLVFKPSAEQVTFWLKRLSQATLENNTRAQEIAVSMLIQCLAYADHRDTTVFAPLFEPALHNEITAHSKESAAKSAFLAKDPISLQIMCARFYLRTELTRLAENSDTLPLKLAFLVLYRRFKTHILLQYAAEGTDLFGLKPEFAEFESDFPFLLDLSLIMVERQVGGRAATEVSYGPAAPEPDRRHRRPRPKPQPLVAALIAKYGAIGDASKADRKETAGGLPQSASCPELTTKAATMG